MNVDVLFNLENAESIPCPLEQSWYFQRDRLSSSSCQARAFHHCASSNTFQLSYNNRCETNQG